MCGKVNNNIQKNAETFCVPALIIYVFYLFNQAL